MEDTDIIKLWKAYDRKLNKNLLLNRKNAEEITKIKTKSLLSSMKPIKIFTILTGIIWVGFIDILIVCFFHVASSFFLVSAVILTLLNKLAIGVYVYQLVLINKVDIDKPVLETQESLARLKSSTLWITRILFLQFPLWTTFYLSESLFKNGGPVFYTVQSIITPLFIYIALWFFFNIKYENRDKKWFRLIFRGKEWIPLIKSMELLKQVDEYKNEA